MSESDTILEGLDSDAMQRLETLATNFTSLSFNSADLAGATVNIH